MMFNDDQLDELERLAADNQIEFKRTHSDFSLTRGLQQAQAGFIEGLTTFDLIPKEPRNTGEAIFRQLGHLSGFAPAIMKAPVIGLAKLGAKVTGQKTYGRFTQAALDGIDALDAVSFPMKASRFTKGVFNKGLEKTGADTFDFLKHGARTRAITEEALGLASATAVSSIWKGQDAIVDAYIGGAIAGGAFGGIGNFVSIGNLYKGTPQQVDQANKLLRAGVASAFMGIPSTLRNDPTEMQIYEYLLGGFFGYNTRPAREVEAAKWINKNRDPIEIFRPEKTEEWSKVSRDAQEYILRDHPMTMVMNKEGLGGSTGAALGYLERWAERTDRSPKFREAAVRHFKNNEINYTERDIQDYYRSKAAEIYKLNRQIIENAVLYNNGILNDDRIDIMDETEKQLFNINDISTKISNESTKLGTNRDVGVTIDKIAQRSLENDQPNVELFMRDIRSQFGEDIANKHDSQLRGWFRTRMQKPQNMDLVTLNVDGKTAEYRVIDKEKIGDVDIGEKYDIMPAQYLVPEAQFQLMSHVVREIYTTKGGKTNQEAVKIMQQELVKGEIVYALNQKDLAMVQNKLAENGRYIVHGIKDKDHVLTSRFRDEGLTLDNVFDILSNVAPRSEVEAAYKRSLAGEKQLFGDSKRTEELHERKWISNLVNMAEMNSLRMEDSWIMFDPDTNYGKSVADLNKRMSLFTNRFTPMVKQSFENVRGMPNGEKFNVIIVEDIGLKSDTDGLIEFRSDMLDAQSIAMGRDPKVTGHNKPVIAAKNELGFLATKSNGQEAFPALNDWMMANDVHAVIYKSSAKLRGQNKVSNLEYKDGNYLSNDLNKISLPIETLQISSGTYENTRKDTKGASVPMQLSGQSNEQQAFGFADIYIDKLLRPSLQGSRDGRKIVENFKKNEDVDAFAEQYNKNNIRMEELPFDFVMDILLNKPDSKIGKLLSDRLMRLEVEGALDTTSAETFEFDSDSAFKTFHETNRQLAEALRGTFVAKHTMIFNKKNYFNALRKYAVKRFANPHIETGGKSILKGFRPEMLNYADIDPYSITQTTIVKPDSANSINIMRGSKYGNPFVIPSVYDKSPSYYKNKGFIRAGSTKEAIERYESWLRGKTDKGYMPDKRDGILNDIRSGKLSGRPLGYFKPEAKDSHAVRLVKLINEWSPRTLKEGEIYLDNGFRKMPVVLFGERYTLGEIWDMYTGKKTMPKGVKKPTQEEWNDAFTFLVIRTPADSMSGTRKLRFRGFTNQKGTGSFTHDKDNAYLGGADKDIDSIKIFQGVDKGLVKHFESNANERAHWGNLMKTEKDFIVDLEGAEVEHYKKIVSTDFNKLDSEIDWIRGGKSGKRPIFTQYYGDKGTEYSYTESGKRGDWVPLEWTPELLRIKREVERITGYKFNSAVVNKYKDGKDSIGFHSDNEPELMRSDNRGPVIASVSFGSKRNFILKDRAGKKTPFALEDGDLFLMKGDTQKNYTHGIAKESTTSPRINITFRRTNYGRRDPRKDPEPFRTKTKTYEQELGELFKGNASQQTIDDFMNNKIMMLSPSFRFQVARNSSTAKQGLGYGLSAKLAMQNMYDYVEANGGSVTITGGGKPTVEIKLKTDSPYKGVDAHRFFLDLGTKIVNVSADASNDPNLKSYNQFRDMLFNSIFEVKVNGKEITKYSEFTKQTKGTVFEALKMANDNIKPHQKIYDRGDTPESPTIFEVLDNVRDVNRIIEQSEGVETVNPKLNRLMEEMGFKAINYKFRSLREAHQRLYESVLGKDGLFLNVKGKFELRDNKTARDLVDFYKIISSELSFATPKRIQEMLSKDPDKALDFIGKEIGQYATMELLTDQYIKVQNEFAKQGRNVNTVSELLPMIKQRAYEVKELASELSRRKERDNVINNDLNGLIQSTKNNLARLERAQGLQEGMLQDYFHYWLLSPIRPLQKGKNQPQFNKAIHGSNMIPMSVKRKFYQQMDDIYNRAKEYDFKGLDIKEAETVESIKKTMKEEKPLVNNVDLFLTINKALEKKELEGLALFDSDVKEIHRFQERLETNPIFRKDFNQWYEGFTTNLGDPRDATTLKMQDIKLVNRYLDSLNKNKDIELKLAQFYQSPLTVDEVMQAKGLFGGYHKILNVPIKTSKGTVRRDVKIMMSPVGNIAHYFRKSEASMGRYRSHKQMETKRMDSIIKSLSDSDQVLYMDNLFSLREGRNKKGEAFTEADIDPKINRVKFDQLNKEFTKFWKRMEESWITTKDVNGNRFDWSIIDKDKQYGKINEYIRYDKNGKFDFKFFENKVLNAREQTQEIIRKVGIEGVLRYRHEYAIERALRLSDTKDPKAFREEQRSEKEFQTFRPRNYERYMHHSFRNSPEGLLVEQAEWLAKQPSDRRKSLARRMQQDNPWINTNDVLDIDPKTIMRETTKLEVDRMDESILQEQGEVPYKRSYDIVSDYQTNLIQAYHRNLMKLKAQNEIDLMIKNASKGQMKGVDKKAEKKYFKKLYKGIQDASIESGGIPKKLRYNSYIDVWADYIRLYARDSLGYQTFISERMSTPQGRRLLHLNKKNLYWGTSDEAIIKHMEKLYQSKLGKKRNIPFFNEKSIPKDPTVRKEYFSRMIHNLGRLEAQYELLSLLANTGTWTTNMFGGATMTMGSAGAKNYAKSFNNKIVYDVLLSDAKGNAVLKLLDGTKVTNRKELMTYLEDRGVIDNFIKHEFEYNEPLTSGLKKAGVNIKDFQRDLIKAAKSKKGDRDESVMNVINRYGVKDLMLRTGSFLMKHSERVNRLNAFIAHGIQAVEGFKGAGKELSLADQYVFERAERGIEMTQFLYQNSHRPAFMRTSMGKVLGRFKLFVFNSVRMRKEFYKQAKLQGFKEGTESYERFKDTFAIDMMMYALGSAFMFSLFDTTLPPPWDWVQALADYTFGDKREKEMAFFGSKLGPLNVLKPPIARVPEAFGELLTGQWEDFTNYTMYTMFPFGRGIRQIKQLADDRPFRGVERAPEILFRIPYNQMKSRIERAQRQIMQQEEIEEYLNV